MRDQLCSVAPAPPLETTSDIANLVGLLKEYFATKSPCDAGRDEEMSRAAR